MSIIAFQQFSSYSRVYLITVYVRVIPIICCAFKLMPTSNCPSLQAIWNGVFHYVRLLDTLKCTLNIPWLLCKVERSPRILVNRPISLRAFSLGITGWIIFCRFWFRCRPILGNVHPWCIGGYRKASPKEFNKNMISKILRSISDDKMCSPVEFQIK